LEEPEGQVWTELDAQDAGAVQEAEGHEWLVGTTETPMLKPAWVETS
jgi:hypothetical protein